VAIAVLVALFILFHPLIHAERDDHPGCPLCTGAVSIHCPISFAALISFPRLLFSIAVSSDDCIATYDPAGFYCTRAPPETLLFS
jgi:hypothetical protein